MTIQEMLERKRELGYSYEQISEYSGVPLGTVQKVLGGITQSPRYETLRALEDVLKPVVYEAKQQESMLRESVACYGVKRQGEYTIEDYYALPDDQRVELIDGVFYEMTAPSSVHQMIGLQLAHIFLKYIEKKEGKCIPLVSPIDVQLDMDDKTMVQPDVVIICDRSKVHQRVIYGAPDFVAEVLSPSTKRKDMVKKLEKYMNAGVKEYWMVDPKKKCIIVYVFHDDEDDSISFYTFDDEVPVSIYDGDCKVNFKEIYEYMSFLY
jgi:Uma2 family endonuclease